MTVSAGDYAEALYEAVTHDPAHAHDITLRLIERLTADHNKHLLPLIRKAIYKIDQKEHNQIAVIVRVPIQLTETQKDRIMAHVRTKYTNKEIILTEEVDPSLIAGIQVRIGDMLIDNTVKGRLDRLTEQLSWR